VAIVSINHCLTKVRKENMVCTFGFL